MTKDRFIVIYPTQIEPLPSPGDFGITGRHEESAYLQHLLAEQPLIKEYEETGMFPVVSETLDDDFYIEKRSFAFHTAFFDPGVMIHVNRTDVNTFIPSSSGHHRMYIARKYGLKLIAYLDNPEAYYIPYTAENYYIGK